MKFDLIKEVHTRRSKTTLSGVPSETLRSKSTITILSERFLNSAQNWPLQIMIKLENNLPRKETFLKIYEDAYLFFDLSLIFLTCARVYIANENFKCNKNLSLQPVCELISAYVLTGLLENQ